MASAMTSISGRFLFGFAFFLFGLQPPEFGGEGSQDDFGNAFFRSL